MGRQFPRKRSEVSGRKFRAIIELQNTSQRNEEVNVLRNWTNTILSPKHGRQFNAHAQHLVLEFSSSNHWIRHNDLLALQELLKNSADHPESGTKSHTTCSHGIHPSETPRTDPLRFLLTTRSNTETVAFSMFYKKHSM